MSLLKKWLLMLMNIVVYFGAAVLAFYVINPYIFNHVDWYKTFMGSNIPIQLTATVSMIFIMYFLIFKIKKMYLKEKYESLWSICNFSMLNIKQMVWFTLIGFAGSIWFISLMNISYISESFPGLQSYIELFATSEYFIYTFLGVGIIGVFYEEILFRGLIFNEFRKVLPLPFALLLNAVIYGLFQPSPVIMVTGFLLGILYGLIYVKTMSLWSTIWIGSVLNISIFSLHELKVDEGMAKWSDAVLIPIHILTFLFMLLFVIYFLKSDVPNENSNIKETNVKG
ncbi:CPBP family intramembrane glutamic endopeptidase [Chengkuizengella sediminis]|uniref:CPBP family intramembrane glutamic endopeptidase n=1 Tax=Chengkuizengella sediminis TaxID=1885917 RepID=UPI001389AE31|nr:type II CAAX endopeptidase family protein [Chengkuizengella sediminis]NDI36675.1 CPBP family intramembrane metalloprotease [Chengkuizengella sediminis]